MAAVAAPKKKCKYWDKCFRSSSIHKRQFLHPEDDDEDEKKPAKADKGDAKKSDDAKAETSPKKTPINRTKLVKMGGAPKAAAAGGDDAGASTSTSNGDVNGDVDDDDKMDTTPAKDVKCIKRKIHAMSQSDGEEDEEPAATPAKKVKTADTSKKEVEPAATPAKKVKTADTSKKAKDDDDDDDEGEKKVKKVRMRCKYWDKCYQKNKSHMKEFIHPGDYDAPDEEEEEQKRTRSKTKTPLHEMKDGETVDVGTHRIKRTGNSYHCTCPGWKNQKEAPDSRTCKHLKEYLGEEFENQRTGADKPKKKKGYIPGHINVSVLLAQKYVEGSINPVGWWMSEKLDGVRAYWNGRCFYSRLGNAFIAPEWFTKDLPTDMHLDGELFGGRGKFQSTVSIVKTPEDDRWKKIKYHVFDAPNMGSTVFEKRYEELDNYFTKHNPKYAILCEQTKCTGQDHIDEDMDEVLALGGEGLMLRQPKSQYEKRRSPTLLKIKKFHDAEAVVIAHEPGKPGTKNQYLCGALRCRMECGKEFSVGSGLTDAQRKKPPKIGAIITYKFQEYTNSGSPRFPTFIGVRIDADGPKDAILPKKPSDD